MQCQVAPLLTEAYKLKASLPNDQKDDIKSNKHKRRAVDEPPAASSNKIHNRTISQFMRMGISKG